MTVAIVDGRPGGCAILAEHLGAVPGVAVVGTATTLPDAVELARARTPRVVVLDTHGLSETALELVRRLSELAPPPAIVALAAHVTAAEHATLKAAGVRTVLLKQIDSRSLVGAIRDAGRPTGPLCG